MLILTPAKINLRLKVEGVRSDGYHLLNMLNIPINLFDEIEIEETNAAGLDLIVEPAGISPLVCSSEKRKALAELLSDKSNNIIAKAYENFCDSFQVLPGLKVKLKKNIPIGAGLGGGSTDAAAILRFLSDKLQNEIIKREKITAEQFHKQVLEIATTTGADVPFFMANGPAIVSGVGDVLKPIKFVLPDDVSLFLIVSNESLSTREVFQNLNAKEKSWNVDERLTKFIEDISKLGLSSQSFLDFLNEIVENDLQESACSMSPLLIDTLSRLNDDKKINACLTGSGSGVFVLPRSVSESKDQLLQLISLILADLPLQVIDVSPQTSHP